MSKIDLERLVVRRTYFIPIPHSKLMTAVLNELRASDIQINGRYSWYLVEEHRLSFSFLYSLKFSFVTDSLYGIKIGSEKWKKTINEKLKEFEELGDKAYVTELERLYSNLPWEIYVSIKKIEENGCLCKVECLPTLYEKLRCLEGIEPNDFEIQNAYLTCKRFLETIFEGGLSATLVLEEKKELLKPSTQLLINDQTSREILHKIENMLDQATGEVLLCGWIGTILLPKLKEISVKGITIRVITHKAIELKGQPGKQDVQRAFGELISMIGKDNISIRPECHCRVVVVDNKALIGSMDLNAISLTGAHRELGIYTEDPEIVRNLRNYFNEVFSPLSKEKAK